MPASQCPECKGALVEVNLETGHAHFSNVSLEFKVKRPREDTVFYRWPLGAHLCQACGYVALRAGPESEGKWLA